jgi:hypothetical protein
MKTTEFVFSPRVALVLENFETVREVLKICLGRESELAEEVSRFLVWFEGDLVERLPRLKSWKAKSYSDYIELYPGDHWRVQGKDKEGICIRVSFIGLAESDLYDPGAGLYVPKQWSLRETFIEELNKRLPRDLRALRWPEPDWPFFCYVHLKDHLRTATDLEPLLQKIAELVDKLMSMSPEIDAILKKPTRRLE